MKDFFNLYEQANKEIRLSDQEKQTLIDNILKQDAVEESSARWPKRARPFVFTLVAACLVIVIGVGISLAFPVNTATENSDPLNTFVNMESTGSPESSSDSQIMRSQDSSILSVAISVPCETTSDEIGILIKGEDYLIRQSESDAWSKSITLKGNSSGVHEVHLGISLPQYDLGDNSSIDDESDEQLSLIHESLGKIETASLELVDGNKRTQFSFSYEPNVTADEIENGTIEIIVIEK